MIIECKKCGEHFSPFNPFESIKNLLRELDHAAKEMARTERVYGKVLKGDKSIKEEARFYRNMAQISYKKAMVNLKEYLDGRN